MEEIIKVSHLTQSYGSVLRKQSVLQDVSFGLERGSFTALIGKSGSGKTTLLNCMAGLQKPDGGNVELCGRDLYGLKEEDRTCFRRKRIGYVPQFFQLIPELTVYDNICLPVYLDHRTEDKPYVRKLLKRLGLEGKEEVYVEELSGGEQQRVAVARALSGKPEILLADEPTGNLDPVHTGELLELLHFQNRFFRQTIVLVTHDLSMARTADRILTLSEGRILSDLKGYQL